MANRGREFWVSSLLLLASLVILFFAAKNVWEGNQLKNANREAMTQNSGSANALPSEQPAAKAGPKMILAYYAPGLTSSQNSMKQNLKDVNVVIGMFAHVSSASGILTENDPEGPRPSVDYVHKNSDAKIWALVSNADHGWQGQRIADMFNDSAAENNFINAVHEYVIQNKLDGVSFDFENMPAASKADYPKFLAKLENAFVGEGVQVSVNVPADDPNYDYAGLAANSDYVIVMAYDQHNAATPAGPISSVQWFKDRISKLSKPIPAGKLLIGIGNYAYDWKEGASSGTSMTAPAAAAIAKQKNLSLFTDSDSLNSHFVYTDAAGTKHDLWLLDSVSAGYELDALHDIDYAGVALFRFGSEDPFVWQVLERVKTPND